MPCEQAHGKQGAWRRRVAWEERRLRDHKRFGGREEVVTGSTLSVLDLCYVYGIHIITHDTQHANAHAHTAGHQQHAHNAHYADLALLA